MITWRPIAELPDELKDGREVLLWDGDRADVGSWAIERWWDNGPGWNDTGEGAPLLDVTHFAEINAPDDFRLLQPAKVEVKGEFGWYLASDYRAALEAVEPDRNVRVKDGDRILFQGTAAELLALAEQ